MPTDVVDVLHEAIRELRAEMHREHAQLRADVIEISKKLTRLDKRVMHLEHDSRITRWCFAVGGAVIALVLREVVPLLLG